MVEHAAQRVFRAGMLHRVLDRLADRDAEAAVAVRIRGEHLAAEFRFRARAGVHGGAVGLHEQPAVGLLVEAHLHHVNVALESKHAARKRQRRAPLARAGFGGEALGAGDFVVVGLRDCGVGLVAAGGAAAFVFVVDVRGRLQRLLEPHGAQQRRGTVERVDLAHLRRNLDHPLRAHFLRHKAFRKHRRHQVRRDRLARAGMQRRGQRFRKIRQQVVPVGRHFLRTKQELGVLAHDVTGIGKRKTSVRLAPGPGAVSRQFPPRSARRRHSECERFARLSGSPLLPPRHAPRKRPGQPGDSCFLNSRQNDSGPARLEAD